MTGSVTELFYLMREGIEGAAIDLVQRYLPKLRARFQSFSSRLRIHDADDVAIDAFYEFCKAVENSRLDDVSDRTQLWQVLSIIAARKANDYWKTESAIKRGGNVQVISLQACQLDVEAMDQTPDLHLDVLEQIDSFLRSISNPKIRRVAELKLKGYTNQEIADQMKVTRRTVQNLISRLKSKLGDAVTHPVSTTPAAA